MRHRSIGATLAPLAPDAPPRVCVICGATHRRASLVCGRSCAITRDILARRERQHPLGVLADPIRTARMPAEAEGLCEPVNGRAMDFGGRFDWVMDFTRYNRRGVQA